MNIIQSFPDNSKQSGSNHVTDQILGGGILWKSLRKLSVETVLGQVFLGEPWLLLLRSNIVGLKVVSEILDFLVQFFILLELWYFVLDLLECLDFFLWREENQSP